MGFQPQRGERYVPPGFYREHGIGLVVDSIAATVGMALSVVVGNEPRGSLFLAGACAATVYLMRELRHPLPLGLTKAGLAGLNAFALVEMVTTFQSAPMATGELIMLAGINYLLLSRLAPRGGGEPAS